ncbi:MAG TPA: tetratricopeptide repeat protein [Polyangia bacterium]|nr:tetratricopeptide repeat protein [Polyangia bacterium]
MIPSSALVALLLLAGTPAARANDEASAAAKGSQSTDPDGLPEARRLFREGQFLYDLGDYAASIDRFRKAYQLTKAPALLFNLAQANRLSGNCARALNLYRTFLRVDPQSPFAGEAQKQTIELAGRCQGVAGDEPSSAEPREPRSSPPAPAPPSLAVNAASAEGTKEPLSLLAREASPPSKKSTFRLPGYVACGVGLATGVVGGALYLWNDGRYSLWKTEDRRLATGPTADGGQQAWAASQSENDQRLRSIQNVDRGVLVLSVVSATAIAAGITLLVLHRRAGTDAEVERRAAGLPGGVSFF